MTPAAAPFLPVPIRPVVAAAAPAQTGFRADIEGLRGIAVLLVVLYHAGLPGLGGGYVGVDVFFVLSGYLITGLLAKELGATGGIDLLRFYARRARRLLPAAAVTSLATFAAALLLLSPMEQQAIARAGLATTLYVSNFWFMAATGDYFQAEAAANPLLHTWSLSVEEQFYFVWPLILVAVFRWRRSVRALAVAVAVLSLCSLLASLWLTYRFPFVGFYASPARAWEFGVGGLASLVPAAALRSRARWAGFAGWLGFVAVLASAVLYSGQTAFPGIAALLPAVGTAALLLAGAAAPGWSLDRTVFRSWPLQRLGQLSYSWYLWHWPVLAIAAAVFPGLSLPARLLCGVASLGLAAAAYHLLENPVRVSLRWKDRPTPVLGAAIGIMLLVAGAALGAAGFARAGIASPQHRAFAYASADLPVLRGLDCIAPAAATRPRECSFGSSAAPVLVLFGDSHAAQWFPGLEPLAAEREWRIVTLVKTGCPAPLVAVVNPNQKREYRECGLWREAALKRIAELRPAVVVVSSFHEHVTNPVRNDWSAPVSTWRNGTRDLLARLDRTGTRVLLVRDSPTPATYVPYCLSRARRLLGAGDGSCDTPRAAALNEDVFAAEREAAAGFSRVSLVDFSDLICTGSHCPAVVGGRVVYRDEDHLAASFTRSLAPELARHLARAGAGAPRAR